MFAVAWAWFKGSKIAMWGAAALAALLAALGILARERAKGREQERTKQDKVILEEVKEAQEVKDKAKTLPIDEIKEKNKPFIRGKNP